MVASTPLVSVIVRSVDRPELQEALASVAEQTYPAIEVVLVDAVGAHASPARQCGPFPLRLVSRGEPLIRSRAANVGLDAARGRYVIFLDDDDLFLPTHVARLTAALESRPGRRAAYAGVRVEGSSGVIDIYDQDFDPARLIAWNHLPTAGVMLERTLLDEGVRFDEALDLYEDWDFWLQVAARTPFARAPGISAVWRPHLGRSGMINPEREGGALVAARRYVWRKWLAQLAPDDFERLIASFRNGVAEQDARLADAAHRENDLRTEQTALQRVIKDERAAVRRWRRELRDTTRQLQAVAVARLAEAEALSEAQRQAAALQDDLAHMRASTSWRLTAPLRRAVEMLRRRS